MADKFVRIKDTNGNKVNISTDESSQQIIEEISETVAKLNQLIAKIPVGLQVDASNRLRVMIDTSSSVNNYEYWTSNASTMLNTFTGQNGSKQVWQQQRNLIGV